MSRDRIVKVHLEKILDYPNIIVLEVKKQNPFSEEMKKKIKGFKSIPPFTYHINYYEVEEIIYNGASVKIKEEQKIAVRSANFKGRFDRHKKYYVDNFRKSIYVYEYATQLDIYTADRAIVFIIYNKEDNIFEYKVGGAYDSIDKKEKILHLLK